MLGHRSNGVVLQCGTGGGGDQYGPVDLASSQIDRPSMGLVSEEDFWGIYYDKPKELSVNVDFQVLGRLRHSPGPYRTSNTQNRLNRAQGDRV